MMAPVALQLYSVRDALAQDLAGTIRTVAQMGFAGVETAGIPTLPPSHVAGLLRDAGLTVCGAHLPLPLGDQKSRVLDVLAALDCKRLICPYQPPESFQSVAEIRRVSDVLNEAHAVAREHGLAFGYHNHWWEYLPVEGRTADRILLEYLDPAIFLEVDTYWVQVAGQDPAGVVRALGARAPLLHIKDGPATREAPMTAVGEGVLDIDGIVRAGQGATEWLVVELDHCATDLLAAVRASMAYLAGKGLGYGRDR